MIDRLTAAATYAAYHASVALGIALLPLALFAKRLGVTLPIGRLLRRTTAAYRASR